MISRRTLYVFCLATLLLLVPTFLIAHPESPAWRLRNSGEESFSERYSKLLQGPSGSQGDAAPGALGQVIMPKMGNETAKAQLGNAGWRLLHTMAQRYPENPTQDQRDTFKSFLYLFSQVYPCGECAQHFQGMLAEFPPQTANRNAASLYLCMLHNKVNARLGKDEFDCSQLQGLYDCGCTDEPEEGEQEGGRQADAPAKVDKLTGEELVPGRRS